MNEKSKILVARIGAIGDICMLIPLVHALSRHYEVHWLIRDSHMPIVQCFPAVACRLIGVSPASDETQPFAPKVVATLRDEHYACLIDFSHWPCIGWLAHQLGDIPIRAVTHDPPQDALLSIPRDPPSEQDAFNCLVPVPPNIHQVDKWRLLVLAACGIDLELDWPLPVAPTVSADRPLRVLLHADAGKLEKVWPAARFANVLAGVARRQRVHCVINKVRRRTVRQLRWRLLFSQVRTELAALDPSFRRLQEVLCRSDVAIGCDSGPMHFASLLGVPTLVVYGRYPAAEFAPRWRSTAVSPPRPGMDADAVPADSVAAALAHLVDELRQAPQA